MIIKASQTLIATPAAAIPLLLSFSTTAAALTPLEQLGKNVFFDKISNPGTLACASCHDPAVGWVLPDSNINNTIVVAPGAAPQALGVIKPPSNAYAIFSPPFSFQRLDNFEAITEPAQVEALIGRNFQGGSTWNGFAEGFGKTSPSASPIGDGGASATVTVDDIPPAKQAEYAKFLGPLADQALNPFPSPIEHNISKQGVCEIVQSAAYKDLYNAAYDEAIDCSGGLETSFKRIALALAAWEASDEVNQFSSRRDQALAADADKKFPLDGFTAQENLGHDLFYGRNDSGQNPEGKSAGCSECHNSGAADSDGTEPDQLYTDNRYHHTGLPFNPEIPGVGKGVITGLTAHISTARPELIGQSALISVPPGPNRAPTLRNVAAPDGFIKAYGHNGYFKSLEQIVHFYNTSLVFKAGCASISIFSSSTPVCTDDPNATPDPNSTAATWPGGPITRCPGDMKAGEAIAANCWPEPEFPNATTQSISVTGNQHLTQAEEEAVVQFVRTFTDQNPVTRP
ncbi:cytochrome-c peroxidase [Methylobacter sp.]|uniref:cytochrome-c peroxidase n=1 Tax=Methylobacter sp. TaxID=2051955 RepID=UPI003DA3EC7B